MTYRHLKVRVGKFSVRLPLTFKTVDLRKALQLDILC